MLYCIIDTILPSYRAISLQLSFQIIRIYNCLSEFTTCVISVKQNIEPLAFPCSLILLIYFYIQCSHSVWLLRLLTHFSSQSKIYNEAYANLHKEIMKFSVRRTASLWLKPEESHFLPQQAASGRVQLEHTRPACGTAATPAAAPTQHQPWLQTWGLWCETTTRVQLWKAAVTQGLDFWGLDVCHQGPCLIMCRPETLGCFTEK